MNIFLSVYIKKHRRSLATLKVLMYEIRKRGKLFGMLIIRDDAPAEREVR